MTQLSKNDELLTEWFCGPCEDIFSAVPAAKAMMMRISSVICLRQHNVLRSCLVHLSTPKCENKMRCNEIDLNEAYARVLLDFPDCRLEGLTRAWGQVRVLHVDNLTKQRVRKTGSVLATKTKCMFHWLKTLLEGLALTTEQNSADPSSAVWIVTSMKYYPNSFLCLEENR